MLIFTSLFFMLLCEDSVPVKIQEVSTKKYLKSRGSGPVAFESERASGTDFVLENVDKDKFKYVIKEKGSNKVIDFAGGGNKVIVYAKHGGKNQQFRLILDLNGNHQIVQANNDKYIYYDDKADALMGASFPEEKQTGFVISRDEAPSEDPYEYLRSAAFHEGSPMSNDSYKRSWISRSSSG